MEQNGAIETIKWVIGNLTNKDFFSPNLWGIIGSISGILGLYLNWRKHRNETAKIEVEEIVLQTNLISPNWFTRATIENIHNNSFRFRLSFFASNRRGGAGSIDKPSLVIRDSGIDKVKLEPVTKETRWHRSDISASLSISEGETIDYGKTIYLQAGEKVGVELEYYDTPRELKWELFQHSNSLEYFVEYRDNRGKSHRIKVNAIKKW